MRKLSTKRFISLDISTKCTGWAIFDGYDYLNSGIIDVSKILTNIEYSERMTQLDANRREKMLSQREEIETLLIEYNISYIVKEAVRGYRNTLTAVSMGYANGMIESLNLPTIDIDPNTWMSGLKKRINVVGKSKKKSKKRGDFSERYWVDNYFYEIFDRFPYSNDESDAYAIGIYHLHYQNDGFSYEDVINLIDCGIL